jgi:S-adenosyl methyltransferase
VAENNPVTVVDNVPPDIDPTVPHVSRVLDYLLGGTANFAVDRAVAEQAFVGWPGEVGGVDGVRVDIRGARASLARIVRYLTEERSIRQFLDICSGLPTEDNTHEVAQRIAPESAVVYVDNDPLVVQHAQYLLADAPGRTVFVEGDLHDPEQILRQATATLDLSRPVGIILFGALHFFTDDDGPDEVVHTLVDAVPSGSHIAFSHFARADGDGEMDGTFEQLNQQWGESVVRRTADEVLQLFDGLELVEPGVVELPDWRPGPGGGGPRPMPMWCGVLHKP